MCGICGIVDLNQSLSEKKAASVDLMNQALIHRGPDESGTFNDAGCALAMRRLAIIDIAQGQQPQFNADGNICVFQNGEIYNFLELKNELIQEGFVFKTNSDTEVLAHLYQAKGTSMFGLLKGMFAICIYDIKKQVVLLARDRFGEKPVYYHWKEKVLSFSSEIKSLLANTKIERKLNIKALPYYFRTSLVPEPITLLEGVKSLLPGHFLRISKDQLVEEKYFHLTYSVDSNIKTTKEAITLIQPRLEEAVKRQTVSDVPIGAFLSGGIDSSTVVALLQKNSDKPIQTFNARFEDQGYDESPIARKVADFCGTDHHELVIPNYDFEESIFWTIIDHVGLPFRDSSAIPSYFISKAIGKQVKVALSGDGGDELFGGYAMFQWQQKITTAQHIPKPLRQLTRGFINQARKASGLRRISKLRQIDRALRTSFEETKGIPIALNEMFLAEQIPALFRKGHPLVSMTKDFEYSLLKQYPPEAADWSTLRKAMYYRSIHTLPANMLIKVDRMSMANSLEVRAPFLDPDLFDAAAQLPDHFLIREGKGKWLIRKIMEKELPSEVFNHPKMGFSIPLFKYQNEAFQKLAHKLLFEENPFPELWSTDYLKNIYTSGLNNKQNTAHTTVFQSAHRLWMLMQLLGWAIRFKVKLT